MPTILLSPKFWGALALVALIGVAVNWHAGKVADTHQAGYDKRELELSEAAGEAATKLNEAESVENAKAIKLQKELTASRALSDKLAAQIRDASFKCANLGPSFVELYNAGTRAGSPLPAP